MSSGHLRMRSGICSVMLARQPVSQSLVAATHFYCIASWPGQAEIISRYRISRRDSKNSDATRKKSISLQSSAPYTVKITWNVVIPDTNKRQTLKHDPNIKTLSAKPFLSVAACACACGRSQLVANA